MTREEYLIERNKLIDKFVANPENFPRDKEKWIEILEEIEMKMDAEAIRNGRHYQGVRLFNPGPSKVIQGGKGGAK